MSVIKLKLLNVPFSSAGTVDDLRRDYNTLVEKLISHFALASLEVGRLRPATSTDVQYVVTTDPGPTVATVQVQVDLSKDGAPSGSIGAVLSWIATNASGATSALIMKSASGGTTNQVDQMPTATRVTNYFPVYFVSGSKSVYLTSSQNLTESVIRVVSWIY